jgi:hypothetical protein
MNEYLDFTNNKGRNKNDDDERDVIASGDEHDGKE